MKQIFGSLLASCVLLSGCGGKLQSPDFQSVLKGIDVVFTPVSGSNTAMTAPGSTFRFNALGLYSTPPGTTAGAQTVACGTPGEPAALCTLGEITGVTWSVDPAADTTRTIASIDANGLATGLRRGIASIRARAQGLEATEALVVDGAVLTGFTIAATPGTTVPTGRSITLTATPTCSNRSGATPCIRSDYNYAWALPATLAADTVTFTPSPARGRTISVKTNRFGPFAIDSSVTNEEGTAITQSINLNATTAVLERIIVRSEPVEPAPVRVLVNATTRLVARGVFSDGLEAAIRDVDLGADAQGNRRLVWTPDASATGRFTVDYDGVATPTATELMLDAPNAIVQVTGDVIGLSGVTARAINTEATPIQLESRLPLSVRDFQLIKLLRFCLATDTGDACQQNLQLAINSTPTFKAQGQFSDPDTGALVTRDIVPSRIPLTWTARTGQPGDLSPVDAAGMAAASNSTGNYRAIRTGGVVIDVALANAADQPAVLGADRTVSGAATIIEAVCRDQLLTSNGATAISANNSGTGNTGSSVTNAGNVIDAVQTTFARFAIAGGAMMGNLQIDIKRASPVIVPPAGGIGFGVVMDYAAADYAANLIRLVTFNGDTVVETLTPTETTTPGGPNRRLLTARATMPYTGIRVQVTTPSLLTISPADPASTLTGLIAALTAGSSVDVDVYAACATTR